MFNNLLLAVDVTSEKGAVKSAAAAVSLAQANGAMLHLLNVVPDTGMAIVGASLAPGHMERVLEAARSELHQWADRTLPTDVNRQIHIAEGTVYDQIIRTANELDVDAIIVGAHRPEFRDYLMGPNAARVARHAKQSVFVVR
jgi:nucleotide-binding universal stress UspA family protein